MEIEELSELVRLHGKALYGFCYKLAGNKADADDLYQETFLKAVELRHRMDADRNAKGFLVAIAIRLRKNSRRKWAWRRRIAPTAAFDEAAGGNAATNATVALEHEVLSRELRGAVQAAVDGLEDKLKIPLYMHYTADMSIDEIAAALRIPSGTVKSRLHKARMKMKKRLEVETR
ncbi:RNA polymerase sigma factor [Cohnella sp. REN36]|uniref:RNA polymerase sigma factor n=1 Tax=Cohnella sp. REN36 TaxID=2887347 RepID=UPI001D146F7D|nr:sigma-70 family RNA polymerase sigma factor [Cohnella sp. REN36]MCC3376164.1 sigma-70 family RNA polymerase sigma factor [Cohnella sp. REN36]